MKWYEVAFSTMVTSRANVARDGKIQEKHRAGRVQVLWSEWITLLGISTSLLMLHIRQLSSLAARCTCNVLLTAQCATSQPVHLL